jgi:hypothetical protein
MKKTPKIKPKTIEAIIQTDKIQLESSLVEENKVIAKKKKIKKTKPNFKLKSYIQILSS